MVAAIRGVGGDLRIGEQVEIEHREIGRELLGQPPGIGQLKGRLKGPVKIIGPYPAAAGYRGIKQVSRIGAAGKGDCSGGMLLKKGAQGRRDRERMRCGQGGLLSGRESFLRFRGGYAIISRDGRWPGKERR